MARRADQILGGAAALVAVAGIAVFGYRTLKHGGDDDKAGPAGDPGSRPAGPIGPEVPRRDHLVDEDYRFSLTAPGPAWEVFDRADTDPVWFGELAAVQSDRAVLQVSIDRIGDIANDRAADRVETWVGGKATARRPITWLGRDVIELEFDTGEPRRERVFVRDGMLHDISLVRGGTVTSWDDLEADAIWAAFELLDGTPRPRTPSLPIRDQVGVGWRVHGATWESAIAGVRVTPPSGWRLVTGRALGATELDVELSNEGCGCYVSMTSFVGAPAAPAPKARTMSVEVLGAPYVFVAAPDPELYQVWDATIVRDDGLRIAFQGWYPKLDATIGITELRRAFAAFSLMTVDEREALARALERPRYDDTAIGPTWALRSGVYADYQWGLVWRRSAGFWRIATGVRANELLEQAVLVATEPRMRIVLFAVPDDAVLEPGHITQWFTDHVGKDMASIDLSAVSKNRLLGPGVEGVWVDEVGASHLHRVMPLAGGPHSFRIHIGGSPEAIHAHEAEIAAALGGLDLRSVAAVDDRDAAAFVDRRYGYKVELPGWRRNDRGDTGTSIDRTWDLDDNELIAVVAETATGGPSQRITQMRGRLTASAAAGLGTAPRPHERTDKLAGETAILLTWREGPTLVTVFVLEHDHLLYTVFTRGTAATVDTARKAFRFVPRPD